MKSLKERLTDAARSLDTGPSVLDENRNLRTLLLEAAGAVPTLPEARRQFDPVLVGVLAHVIRDYGLHTASREDTIGVLLKCGAFHAEPVESNRDGFIADLSTAIDAYHIRFQTADYGCAKKLLFGELEVGEHFISWPLPGDNSGHGGFKGAHRMFVKTAADCADTVDSGLATNGSGVQSTFPRSMHVIRVILT